MLSPIPVLEDYDVSPRTGFLPEELPLEKLDNPYFAPWEDIAKDLPSLIMTRRLRFLVDKMPLLSTDKLATEAEWRRACSILGFICHGYVWAGVTPSEQLPIQLAEPWISVNNHFDLPPIATYAGLCLWNHRTVFPVEPEQWDLESLATLNTFTGCVDESWFYLVSTAIERQGAPCLTTGLDAIRAVRQDDPAEVIRNLQKLAEAISSIADTLSRMYEMCDPHIFYFRIRPFLAGWKNMADAGLPDGVRYGNETEFRQYAGGSNAQSSLIQALDIILSVHHNPPGEHRQQKVSPSVPLHENPDKHTRSIETPKKNNFIQQMRSYMPGKHREFLEALTEVAEIREYVVRNSERVPELVLSYDACLAMLRAFRDRHIQIVSRYIILQAQRQNTGTGMRRHGLATAEKATRGTGGTALIPFLKQARDETGDAAAGTWGRRLLQENRNMFPTNAQKQAIKPGMFDDHIHGLAGEWTTEQSNTSVPHW